ncbi:MULTISPECIES: hypothetical protein [Bradyrhizobium]|uniref:Uncharacterized protein n=1 Tax=Bradyrhizobium yuanmingense TaxID=108015 RepID=A0A1C3UD08_9BRAD|nr:MULTISPECIES: hypothetical protein [Bradyrhizobium]MCA1379831.1 hypothetical protein [Bradyrhizobium sp. BRP05]MCA1420155.1 hypothetical protein [Bradyrhizobium sp. BRP23]TWI20838.1 hypothetical protein IQ15_06180 [Bradyrhizobium yuanmingense]SCB13352.1 hypothetical protein GA0061099_1001965 [Bradyrhizobium yuanmingense]
MTEITGTELLRQVAAARVEKIDYARLAKDVGIAPDDLFEFAQDRKNLPADTLCRLTTEMMQGTRFYPDRDLLGPVAQVEAKPLGIRPPRCEAKPQNWKVGEMQGPGPQPLVPQPLKTTKRAGWLGGWV